MKSILLFCLVFVFACTQQALSQDTSLPVLRYNNCLGVVFSNTTGSGLSYTRRFADVFHARTVLFYYMSDNGSNNNSVFNAALEFQYDLARERILDNALRVYVAASARYYHEADSRVQFNSWIGPPYTDTTVSQSNFVNSYSLGFGTEIFLLRRLSLGVQLGYGYRLERKYPEYFYSSSQEPQFPKREILPTIGVHVGFLF